MEGKKEIKWFKRPEKTISEAKPSSKNPLVLAEDKIKSYLESLRRRAYEREEERKRQRQIEKDRQFQLKRQIELEKKILSIDTEFPYRADSYKSERPPREEKIKEPEKPSYGNPFASDKYGTLAEDWPGGNQEEDSGNFPRPWSVKRLYGGGR